MNNLSVYPSQLHHPLEINLAETSIRYEHHYLKKRTTSRDILGLGFLFLPEPHISDLKILVLYVQRLAM